MLLYCATDCTPTTAEYTTLSETMREILSSSWLTTHMMEETSKSTHHKRRTFQTIAPSEDMGTKEWGFYKYRSGKHQTNTR